MWLFLFEACGSSGSHRMDVSQCGDLLLVCNVTMCLFYLAQLCLFFPHHGRGLYCVLCYRLRVIKCHLLKLQTHAHVVNNVILQSA